MKRLTINNAQTALAALAASEETPTQKFVTLFEHGTLEIEYYKPEKVDYQQPHAKDEVYVVISGTGTFVCGGEKQPFVPHEVLFAPAGVEHRFEDFSDDFAVWVIFYGPPGGEADLKGGDG